VTRGSEGSRGIHAGTDSGRNCFAGKRFAFAWGIVLPGAAGRSKAVYLTQDQFLVRGDGNADDSAAIQAAVDKVQQTTGEGILFVPEGRYRVTRTIYVWPGVRLIGYGGKRPVFVLADKTPGFQQGIGCMFFFTGRRLDGSASAGRDFGVPTPPPGNRSAEFEGRRCELQHLLFRDEQYRFRDRQR